MQPIFVLVHSPSVGPSTWHPVADHLTAAGYQVRVPSLLHMGAGAPPFWPRIVDAVRDDLRQVPAGSPVTLVAHSNAGLFLPTIVSGLDHPVTSSIFVDAALPAQTGPTPVATPELLDFLRPMAVNGRLPRWTDWWDEADVAPMFSDPLVRQTVVEEQPTLPLSYYEQHIPVPDGWDDHPCSYLLFGPPYDDLADRRANAAGVWHTCPAHTSIRSSILPAPPGTSSNSPLRLDPLPIHALARVEASIDDVDTAIAQVTEGRQGW